MQLSPYLQAIDCFHASHSCGGGVRARVRTGGETAYQFQVQLNTKNNLFELNVFESQPRGKSKPLKKVLKDLPRFCTLEKTYDCGSSTLFSGGGETGRRLLKVPRFSKLKSKDRRVPSVQTLEVTFHKEFLKSESFQSKRKRKTKCFRFLLLLFHSQRHCFNLASCDRYSNADLELVSGTETQRASRASKENHARRNLRRVER